MGMHTNTEDNGGIPLGSADLHVDHRTLLLKYMLHVEACEGTMFVGKHNPQSPTFTEAEWRELSRIYDETRERASVAPIGP